MRALDARMREYKQLLDSELTKRGVDVNTNICECFSYTRQELFDL